MADGFVTYNITGTAVPVVGHVPPLGGTYIPGPVSRWSRRHGHALQEAQERLDVSLRGRWHRDCLAVEPVSSTVTD